MTRVSAGRALKATLLPAAAAARAARVPAARLVFAVLLLAAACARHSPEKPGAVAALRVAVRAAPRQAGDPLVGPVDTIRVYLQEPGSDRPRMAQAAIAEGQTEFSVSLEAGAGNDRSLSVLALGSRTVLGGPAGPEAAGGILYFARAEGIDIAEGEVTTVPVVLRLFVPVLAPPEVAPGGAGYTIRWNRIPGAERYLVTRILGSGAAVGVPVSDTTFTGGDMPVHCRVTAFAPGDPGIFTRGAPSDYVYVSRNPPPAAPSNLAATTVSTTAIDLDWTDNATDETGFDLQRRLPPGEFAGIAAPAADAVHYSDAGLQPNTTYGYRLRAVNADGASAWTPAAGTTRAEPPGLTAAAVSPRRIDLAWSVSGTATLSFEIERRQPPASFALLAAPGAGTTAWADSGLAENTTYEYRMRILNAAGPSGYSDVASATTTVSIPAAPTGLTATAVSPTRVDLAWTDNAWNETGCEVQRRELPAGAFGPIASLSAGSTSTSDQTVLDNRSYRYRVRAFNGAGNSAWSNEAEVATPLAPPGVPGWLSADPVSSTEIRLRWGTSTGTVEFYDVQRQISVSGAGRRRAAPAFELIASVAAPDTTLLDSRLTEMTWYDYQVTARNAAGSSAPSNTATAATLLDPPVQPSNLQITLLAANRIDLQWMDNSANEAFFEIQRATATGPFQWLAGVAAGRTTWSDTTVAGATLYAYRIRSVNATAASAWSNEVSGTTPPGLPGAPWGLTATAVSTSAIQLAWHPGSGTIDSYDVLRGSPGGALAYATTVPAADTTWLDSGLPENTTYQYRVRARNSSGTALSNAATATTLLSLPDAPTDLFISLIASDRVNLVWVDNSDNEAGYAIESQAIAFRYAPLDTVGPNVTSYSDRGVFPGDTRYYRVRAFNAAGSSAWSNEVHGNVPYLKPGTPEKLVATAVLPDTIHLTWTPGSGDFLWYDIRRFTLPSGPEVTFSISPWLTSYDDGSLPMADYEYWIRAVNPDAASDWSDPAWAGLLVAPAAPTNMDAAYLSEYGHICAFWSDNAVNEENYVLERKPAAGVFTPLATLPAGTQFYEDTSALCGINYSYRVYAVNAAGSSAYSNESPEANGGLCVEKGAGRAR